MEIKEIKINDVIEFGSYPQTKEGDTFKVEPIKWRVLEINNGQALLFAERILDVHRFDIKTNNYANSEIRKWLNEEFYNKAFNEEEKSRILITSVDNSEISTNPNTEPNKWNDGKNKYACENTNDKVFLLSEQEVTNEAYDFSNDLKGGDSARVREGTDYAFSKGIWHLDIMGLTSCNWWLRSPYYRNSKNSRYTYFTGSLAGYDNILDRCGVVPALKIKIS